MAEYHPHNGMTVDADSQAVLDRIAAGGRLPVEEAGVAAARDAMRASRALLGADPVATQVRDLVAPGPRGDIPVRLYRPLDAPPDAILPLFVYFHGGGWVMGDIQTGDAFCAALTARLGIAVAAVDYRLAPEHPFPAAVEDGFAAMDWLAANAGSLDVRDDRIAVGGDSAGGNLAAVCAIRDRYSPGRVGLPLRAQILLYPVTDLRMTSASYRRNARGYLLTAAGMRWFREHYLGNADPGDWRASPLLAAHVDGIAPAFVLTCGFDPLCDEGVAYARRLDEAGVATRHVHYSRQVHGFALWGKAVRDAEDVLSKVADELRQRLG